MLAERVAFLHNVSCSKPSPHCHQPPWEGPPYKWLTKCSSDVLHMARSTFTLHYTYLIKLERIPTFYHLNYCSRLISIDITIIKFECEASATTKSRTQCRVTFRHFQDFVVTRRRQMSFGRAVPSNRMTIPSS